MGSAAGAREGARLGRERRRDRAENALGERGPPHRGTTPRT